MWVRGEITTYQSTTKGGLGREAPAPIVAQSPREVSNRPGPQTNVDRLGDRAESPGLISAASS